MSTPVVDLTGAVLEPVSDTRLDQPVEYRGLLHADHAKFQVQGTAATWARLHGLVEVASAQDAPLAALHGLWRLCATLNEQQIDLLRVVLVCTRGTKP